MKKLIFSALFLATTLFSLTMCQPKQAENEETTSSDSLQVDTTANPVVTSDNFSGTFEYDGGAWENGYLFYRLEMKQTGSMVTGTLFMGNYLSKSAAGGYVMPDATFEADVHGEVYGDYDAMLFCEKVRDSLATDSSSKYPDLYQVFSTDANQDLVQSLTIVNNKLQIICNRDTLLWDKQVK